MHSAKEECTVEVEHSEGNWQSRRSNKNKAKRFLDT